MEKKHGFCRNFDPLSWGLKTVLVILCSSSTAYFLPSIQYPGKCLENLAFAMAADGVCNNKQKTTDARQMKIAPAWRERDGISKADSS